MSGQLNDPPQAEQTQVVQDPPPDPPPTFMDSVTSGAQAIVDARGALTSAKETLGEMEAEEAALASKIATQIKLVADAEEDDLNARKALYKLLDETLPKA